jgi:endonuclease YncB( thermonuclease family)
LQARHVELVDKRRPRTHINDGGRPGHPEDRQGARFSIEFGMARSYIMAHGHIHTALTALALVSALAACSKPEPPLKASAPASIADHVRVLDADGLVIDGKHVRLANAYAPESLLHARCWAESLASDHAAEFVKDLVQRARSYDFKATGDTDSYGRTVGLVSIDNADLGDILYNAGLASRPSAPRFDWCGPISKKAEGAPKISALYNLGS